MAAASLDERRLRFLLRERTPVVGRNCWIETDHPIPRGAVQFTDDTRIPFDALSKVDALPLQ